MSALRAFGTGSGIGATFCALLVAGAAARADVPEYIVHFTASLDQNSVVTYSVPTAEAEFNPETRTYTWELPEPFEFWYETTYMGILETAFIELREDPEVSLNFAVQAGPANADFHIASALLSFPTMGNAEARASAAYSLTDFNGDGATLTGAGATGGAYLAQYNGWAGDPVQGPQGTTFAEGIYLMQAGLYETVVEDFNEPESGFSPISDPVYDMSSLISFNLTAFDLASGTTHFEIVPEPGTLALLALGSLAVVRRRW